MVVDFAILVPVGCGISFVGMLIVGFYAIALKRTNEIGLMIMLFGMIVAAVGVFFALGQFTDSVLSSVNATPQTCQWINNTTTSILICNR